MEPFLITATRRRHPGPAAGAARSASNCRDGVRAQRRAADGAEAAARGRRRQEVLLRQRLRRAATTPATRAASGMFELMIMNDDLRDMIIRNASTDELRDAARKLRHDHACATPAWTPSTTASPRIDEVVRETILEDVDVTSNRDWSSSELTVTTRLDHRLAANRATTDQYTAGAIAMPTYQFEAMDTTGQEVKDVDRRRQRGRSPAEDPPDGLLRHQDRRQEGRKKAGRARKAARRARAFRHRRREHASSSPPSPASSPRCRTPACRSCAACGSSKASEAGPAQERA